MNADPHIDDERFKSLLERWTKGDFTHSDEQALKTLTDPDDFRREAMEGYASAPEADHAERLRRMKAKLRDEEEGQSSGGGRLFTLPRMMAAAAVIALLMVAFWFFPKTGLQEETAPLAQREAVPAPTQAAPTPDATATKGISTPVPTPEGVVNDEMASKNALKSSGKPVISASPALDELADDAVPISESEVVAMVEKADADVKMDKQEVLGASAKPTAPAAPPPGAPQTAAPKDFVVVKEENKKAKTNPPAKNDSAWHDTESRSKLDSVRQQLRTESQMPAYSEPVDGWETFSEYLRQFARLTPEARNNNVSGKVRLQFTVGEEGIPFRFIVVRGLGHGCDEEAIRLVKSWEWVRGKNPLATVEVPFVR